MSPTDDAHRTLTIAQAAALLDTTAEHIADLLDAGRIASTGTGAQRRVRLADVLIFRHRRDQSNQDMSDELRRLLGEDP